jgi:hypothetical protein
MAVPATVDGKVRLLPVVDVMSRQGLPIPAIKKSAIALPELAEQSDSDGPTARTRAEGQRGQT